MTRRSAVEVVAMEGRTRIVPRGALDLDARQGLLSGVRRSARPGVVVEIDLRPLELIDSAGLASLVESDRIVAREAGTRVRLLVRDGGLVQRMLQLTLLHLSLDIRIG